MKTPSRSVRTNGNQIRQIRISRGLTQSELAKLAGYSTRLIRKAESSGLVDLETVRNLAEALSSADEIVTHSQLSSDNFAVARIFTEAFVFDGKNAFAAMSDLLADDFVFICPGDTATAPFIGTWYGRSGMAKWIDLYFSIFERIPDQIVEIDYAVGQEIVIARFLETALIGDQICGPIRVNFVFRFKDGLIQSVEDDYDTLAGVHAKRGAEIAISIQLDAACKFVRYYDDGLKDFGEKCSTLLAPDFEFHCSTDFDSHAIAGTWKGVQGLQEFYDKYFSLFAREPRSLSPEYSFGEQRLVARFEDRLRHQDKEYPAHWVNVHFYFRDGLIARIEKEFEFENELP